MYFAQLTEAHDNGKDTWQIILTEEICWVHGIEKVLHYDEFECDNCKYYSTDKDGDISELKKQTHETTNER